MKLIERLRLIAGLMIGKKYGIIVDTDHASGGIIRGFFIKDADMGIYVAGRNDCSIEDNSFVRSR